MLLKVAINLNKDNTILNNETKCVSLKRTHRDARIFPSNIMVVLSSSLGEFIGREDPLCFLQVT